MVTPIQEHPAFLYNQIALRFGAMASAVSSAAVLLMYPAPRNVQVSLNVAGLAVYFLFVRKYALPRVKTELQLDLAVIAYLLPVFFTQWASILLMPEKEVPAGIACLVVLAGMLFTTNLAFLGMCFFSTTMWLVVKAVVGSINEVEIMQMLVMTPAVSFVARLAATGTLTKLRESRARENRSLVELRDTLSRLQTETTLRRESEERLVLSEKNRSLGMMAAGVAHDFNNTLFAISSLAEIIDRSSSDSAIQARAADIAKAVQQASGICRQMLTYTGKNSQEKCRVDLLEIARELQPLLQASLRHRVTLKVSTDVEQAVILGSAGQLQQVLMNLVTNSAESIEGTGVVEIRIKGVSVPIANPNQGKNLPSDTCYQLTVSDDGCGMSVDTMRQMFDPYFTTKQTGHGFGLSIVQGIARSHNATVSVQSQPGSGTTVSLTFPANPLAEHGTVPTIKTASQSVEGVDSKVVLLIDDDPLVRSSFSTMLSILGWEIVEAESGEAAVEMLNVRNDFLAVVIDYSMPKMNGRETLRMLRTRGCQAPAVLCSGYIAQDDDLLANGEFAAILQKPFRAADLNEILIKLERDTKSKGD